MHRPDTIDAVVFDMGGVFTVQNPAVMSTILAQRGVIHEFDDSAARRGHYGAIRALTELLVHGDVAESHTETWDVFDAAYFRAAGLAEEHINDAKAARAEERETPGLIGVWTHVLEENREGFRRIAQNRPVAIVTNNVGTAEQQCFNARLCQIGPGPFTEVAAIVDSTVVQVAKPDPRIFAPALDALGTEAARTLYVGDTVHADVLGATRAGMPVVQLDPFDLHADHDHWRLPDVVALAEHLS